MINISALVQVKAFARQNGVYVALWWIAAFMLTLYVPEGAMGSLLTMASPIFMWWLAIRFRNEVLDGVISFRRAYVFSCYTFFYASLIFALVQYVFFRYFDHGAIMTLLMRATQTLEQVYQGNAEMLAQLRNGEEAISTLTPAELTFIFMMQNLFWSAVFSLPVALFCRRSTPLTHS